MATEKLLIDANRGDIPGIESTNSKYILGFDNGLIDVMDKKGNIICTFNAKDIPTVDAVEVVHGRWEAIPDNSTFERCSVCKDCYIYAEWDVGEAKWNYCPNCGAKMDGERKDNEKQT